jgi:putative CocE/NonD family hydrolase
MNQHLHAFEINSVSMKYIFAILNRPVLLSAFAILFEMQPVLSFQEDEKNKNYSKQEVMIPVEDSIRLATDIFLPDKGGPFPCILIRSPYNKENSTGFAERFADLGYAVVSQDTRGKFESEGKFYPFKYDRQDGLASIRWIKSQSWSNGKIGGWGGSYVGYTQWAIADHLDAITPVVTSANMYEVFYPSGIYSLATSFNWSLAVDSRTVNIIEPEKIATSYYILPLSVADDSTYQQNDFIDDGLKHPYEDAYWGSMNHRSAVSCPMFSVAGWYDIFLQAQIKDFQDLSTSRHPDSRLVIGPYAHGKTLIETDFGEHADLSLFHDKMFSFLASHLGGEDLLDNTNLEDKTYSLFIIHRNEWYGADQWPPANSRPTAYYFTSKGTITAEAVSSNKVSGYTYDPEDPYPSHGGTFLGQCAGMAFQNPNTSRKDQVVFESGPLDKELVLLGPINATIYVSTDAPSTDFFVSLQEVREDGKLINIQEGGKAIYSDEFSDPRVQEIDISLWATGYQINCGHRIRVVISSSLFPRYNRNLNSGEAISAAHKPRKAHQKIYIGKKFPSHIKLPVLDLK